MSSPVDEEKAQIMQESIEEFIRELDASLTLHHYCQYNDAAKFIEVAQSVHDKALKSLRKTISTKFKHQQPHTKLELEDEFKRRVVQTIKEYESERDKNTMERTEAFLKELVKDVSKHFKSSLELQILLAPDMALERVEKLLETGKESAIRYFEEHSNYGYVGLFWEQKRKLEEKLDEIEGEILEHQRYLLSMRSGEEALQKLKQAVLGMLRQVKSKSGKLKVTSRKLESKVEEFHKSLLEDYGEIYSNSIRLEAEEISIAPAEFIKWAEELTIEPQFVIDKGIDTTVAKIKLEAAAENENELYGGDTEHDIDIDVKIEGVVVDRSSQKPDHVVKRSHQQSTGQTNGKGSDEEEAVRISESQQKLSENEPVAAAAPTSVSMDTNDATLEQAQQRDKNRLSGTSKKRQNVNSSEEEDVRTSKRQKAGEPQPLKGFPVSAEDIPGPTLVLKDLQTSENLSSKEIHIESSEGSTRKQFDSITMETDENGDVLLPQTANSCLQTSKKHFKGMQRSSKRLDGANARKLNVPDNNGDFPLLRSIRNGEGVECIRKLVKAGANVNIKRKIKGSNAAHEVITSLLEKHTTTDGALAVLNLLKDNRFDLDLLNDVTSEDMTPLYYAMEIKDLDENMLTWFLQNGADANATLVKTKESVLLEAIAKGQNAAILRKLLESGANPKQVNKWGQGVLHDAALFGNQSAMEIFMAMDEIDVNQKNKHGATPLHLVFEHEGLDHAKCLRLLHEKHADFGMRQGDGLIPSAFWMTTKGVNKKIIFSTLMTTKDIFPKSEVIASTTLTVIVGNMETLQEFMPSSSSQDVHNEFAQFVIFLIIDKGAKLRLIGENEWKKENWDGLKFILTSIFVEEPKTTGQVTWNGDSNLVQIKATILGKLDFYTDSEKDAIEKVSIEIETVLVSLLACKEYASFVEVCRFIERFCVVGVE